MSDVETRLCPGCNRYSKPIVETRTAHQLHVRCPMCGLYDEIPQGGHA